MRVIWEAEDILAGRRIKQSALATEVWMIGYHPDDPFTKDKVYVMISLDDGMIAHRFENRESFAEYLTKTGNLPIEVLSQRPPGRHA